MNDLGFDILRETETYLVVNKHPGILTQAPLGIDSLEVQIKAFLKERDHLSGDVYLGLAHRLDRPASGAMLLGKTLKATHKLARQFEARYVKKVYWTCVEGQVTPDAGTWRDFVRKVPGEPHAEVVAPDHPEARIAVLHYQVLSCGPWGSWLQIELETGRTHQIRLQTATRGHPVLGDAQYGSTIPFGPQYEDKRLRAIALHARSLAFREPGTHADVTVVAPISADWRSLGLPLD
ncbi:MAG: RNA pseudouridine synthase [Thermoguttaceae bacterium]|jgi:RluA family pseudouridine synthase